MKVVGLILISCLFLSACSSMNVRPTVGVSMGTSVK
ncbi:PBP1b-binding outer membrane lipoprotein LpoB [Acinetobacter bereziniae]|nr:PBP1b-binding outer membrane lipoprotein LpoB [Acinetobacter bereziniae]